MRTTILVMLLTLLAVPLQSQELVTIDVEDEFFGNLGFQLSVSHGDWYATFRGSGSDGAGIAKFEIVNDMFVVRKSILFQNPAMNEAFGFAVTGDKHFIVVTGDSVVHIMDSTGAIISEWTAHCAPANDEEYSLAASDSSSRIYIASNMDSTVLVYSESGLVLDTLFSALTIARTVFVREEDQAVFILSGDSSLCGLDIYSSSFQHIASFNYHNPLPDLPGVNYPDGHDNYSGWKRVVASDSKVIITQWKGYQTAEHRLLIFDKTLAVKHCDLTATADTRDEKSINQPSGIALASDVCVFLDYMADAAKHLNRVYGAGYCNVQAPAAPSALMASYFDNRVELRWTASATTGVEYRIYRRTGTAPFDFSAPPACTTSQTQCVDNSGISPGVQYCYVVRAVIDGYESASSNEVCGTTQSNDIIMTLTPTPIEFGFVSVGQTDTISVTVSNAANSTANLEIGAASLLPPFSHNAAGLLVLAPGEQQVVDVYYSPLHSGEFTQQWKIDHNATNHPDPLQVTVSAGDTSQVRDASMVITPEELNFGMVAVGQSDTLSVMVRNESTSISKLGVVADSLPPPFSHNACSSRLLAPGASVEIKVIFSPQTSGEQRQTWSIYHDATNLPQPQIVQLRGEGSGTDSLRVIVKSIRGALLSDAIVLRFTSEGNMIDQRITDAGGVALWSDIPLGEYFVEVYYDADKPPYDVEEYRGKMAVTVTSDGQNTFDFVRTEPYVTSLAFSDNGNAVRLVNPLSENRELTADIAIANASGFTRIVQGTIIIDRDMVPPYDHELRYGPVEVPVTGGYNLQLPFTPLHGEFYHCGLKTEALIKSTYTSTDARPWSPPECTFHPDAVYHGEYVTQAQTACGESSVWHDDFDNLDQWTKRATSPMERYEDCVFETGAVDFHDGILTLTARSAYEGNGVPGDYYFGGQVRSTQSYSADHDYTISCIMKPSGEDGVVNAFGVSELQSGELRNPDRCYENRHEIRVEISHDVSGMLRCTFSTWLREYQCMRGETENVHCADVQHRDHDRIECSSYVLLPNSYAASFHKYGFSWTPSSVQFMIDDSVLSVHDENLSLLRIVPTHDAGIWVGAWIADRAWNGPGSSVANGTTGTCEVDAVCVSDNTTQVTRHITPDFGLSSPYPNPSNATVAIEYRLDRSAHITLRVYDMLGAVVQTLVSDELPAGTHTATWNTATVRSGVYYYHLTVAGRSEIRKIVVL